MKNIFEKLFTASLVLVVVCITVLLLLVGVRGIHSLTRALIDLSYLEAFLAGILGTSSLMISFFPPQVVAFLMSAPNLGFNPLFVRISMGLGAGIRQYLHYYVGAGGR